MKKGPRDLTPDDRRIWARVTGSVTPPTSRKPPRVIPGGPPLPEIVAPKAIKSPSPPRMRSSAPTSGPTAKPGPPSSRPAPEALEPRRQRRLSRERDPIEARIDLHGYGRFQAQDALTAFLIGAQARGYRSVLVITGQGRRGGSGVIRSSVHDWLTGPALRGIVSGFAPAAQRHGGAGALYVTLKRG